MCIACAHSLASQCMEGHWMWDYQMCEKLKYYKGVEKDIHMPTLINLFLKIQISDLEFSLYVRALWTVNDVPSGRPLRSYQDPSGSFQGVFYWDISDSPQCRYSHQLVPKNSNLRPRIFLERTLWTDNDVPVYVQGKFEVGNLNF